LRLKTAAQITVAFAPLFLAGIYPFICVFRKGRLLRPFFLCWALLVFWMFIFCIVVPLVAGQFNRELAHTIEAEWVPEGPAVVAIVFFGWFYAGIVVFLARFAGIMAKGF
jgi:hypothetical protein